MKDTKVLSGTAYSFEGKMPLRQAIPLGLQHVLAMFVGNLTPLLIITGACGLGVGSEFADLQVSLLQNAMLVAGLVTLLQLFAIGPVGGKVPIILGTSSGFIGVFNSVVANMGGGAIAYGAIMGASIIGGLMEGVLGFFLKPLRRFFPPVVTGTVVLSIGLSLISVGIGSFGGGSGAGVTIQPVAFLTVYQGDVRLVSVDRDEGTADKLVNMIPDVLKKVKGVFKKDKSESADDFSEITQDDIDG